MKKVTMWICAITVTLAANMEALWVILAERGLAGPTALRLVPEAAFMIGAILIMVHPQRGGRPEKRLQTIDNGCVLLRLFLLCGTVTLPVQLYFAVWSLQQVFPWAGAVSAGALGRWLWGLLPAILVETGVFWSGMARLYACSVQLGIKHRAAGILFAWIPGFNIYYLRKLIGVASLEVKTETEKIEINRARQGQAVCKTRYPILMVHGVFFRDFTHLDYWGRIPGELKKNGATVFYGQQQSAASVLDCGKELSERIRSIVQETGCEKVNIIAHSKGGLDSRAAITSFGAAPFVASLTTINTPHTGCLFAEYLLGKMPEKAVRSIADTYNAALKKLGDDQPDFLAAVNDLTAQACKELNAQLPDMPGVLYESVMSYCKKAQSGKFPLNVSYPIVKHFDGKNDGLVAVDAARWGTHFTLLEPQGARGISHGDMIDLNRENIPGFDVREFYVSLVSRLKERGY